MGEKEDREKAEKLAAAKKRVAQLQKKKKAAAAGTGEKSGSISKLAKEEPLQSPIKDAGFEPEDATVEEHASDAKEDIQRNVEVTDDQPADADEALFNDAIKKAAATIHEDPIPSSETISPLQSLNPSETASVRNGRKPSLSLQSKIRSTSFRHTSTSNDPLSPTSPKLPILSPQGETIPDIYRKQALRLEELEKENKRLAKEVEDGEHRWRRSEEELEELREQEVEKHASKRTDSATEITRLRAEIASLTRQNAQRSHAQSVSKAARSGSVPDALSSSAEVESLRKDVESKDSTISDMALEISKLRTQISSQTEGCESHGAQIAALHSFFSTAEGKFRSTERELADAKKNLVRASERALKEGTERTSRDTRIKELEREAVELKRLRDEMGKKAEGLERKVDAMSKLHREADERYTKKLAAVEADARRLRAEKLRRLGKGDDGVEGDGEGVDELEDEERARLERRVHELEGEVYELRRGVWKERRGIDGGAIAKGLPGEQERGSFEVEGFDEVDLSGHHHPASGSGTSTSRKRSLAAQQQQAKHSGFSQVLNSGLAAFRSTTSPDPHQHHRHPNQAGNRPRNESLLQEFPGDHGDLDDVGDGYVYDNDDDNAAFDEAAFAQAQREEEARKMVAHVREVKRKLRDWQGWRLDLVDARRMAGAGSVSGILGVGGGGGGGDWFGEIFEV